MHARRFVLAAWAALSLTGCLSFGGPRPVPTPALWPLDPEHRIVTSRFGAARGGGPSGVRSHKGIDIAAPRGAVVRATADGHVVTDSYQRGYGRMLRIRHGGPYETLYAHLSRRYAGEGDRVRAGEVIGRVGKTGNADGEHLHYEVRRNGKPVDPAPYLPW